MQDCSKISKTACITGASRGIGYEIARTLASKGISIIAIARETKTLKDLKSHFPDKISIISADLGDLKNINEIVFTLTNNIKIDYLINNAATVAPIAPLEQTTIEQMVHSFNLNVLAPIFLTNTLLPFFSENSRILNVTSPAGSIPREGIGTYCISKAALNMASRIQAIELKKRKVHVSQIFPGEVDTDMQQALREASDEQFLFTKEFSNEKEHGCLISPTLCAKFFEWVLLKTSLSEFSANNWNIYDTQHHQHWLKANLPLPYSTKKKEFYQTFNKGVTNVTL